MIFPENNTQDCITLSYFQVDNDYIESEVCEVCAKSKLQDTVEATYKGHLYRGTAAYRGTLWKVRIFSSAVYKFLPYIDVQNCLKPDIEVQIFGDFLRREL